MDAPLYALESEEPPQARSMQRLARRTTDNSGASSAEKAGSGRSGRSPDFQAEGVTLFCADWRDVLPIACDAVVTDQPYGTGWIRGGGKKEGQFKRRKETADWDVFDLAWMDHAPGVSAAFCPIQGVWEMCQRLATPCVLKYRKSNPAPFGAACEPIVSSRPLRPHAGPWEKEAYNGDNKLHPCQKPVPLMAWLIVELTTVGDTVLDPFMGSGSTGIACIRTGRNFVGVEKDPAHFAAALARIQRELSQPEFRMGGGGAEQAGDGNGESESRAGSPSDASERLAPRPVRPIGGQP